MKSRVQIIFNSLKTTLGQLFKGENIIYLFPALLISVFYFAIMIPMGWIFDGLSMVGEIPWIGEWLATPFSWTENTVFWIGNQLYQFVLLTLLSPFMGMLSEKVDNRLTGNTFNGGFTRMMIDLLRTAGIFLVNFFFSFIVINIISYAAQDSKIEYLIPAFLFISNAFFIGFAYFDYSLERYQYGIFESWGYGFKRFLFVTLSGLIFPTLFAIPYVGGVIAPYILTILTTVIWIEIRKSENKLSH